MGLNLAKVKENINNKEKGEFKPITPGRYEMEIEQASVTEINDKEAIEVTLRLTSGDFKNRKVWHRLFLTQEALTYVVLFLQAAGHDELAESDNIEADAICNAIIGSSISGYIKNKLYKGKTYSNAENFQPSGGSGNAAESEPTASPAVEQAPSKKKKLFN